MQCDMQNSHALEKLPGTQRAPEPFVKVPSVTLEMHMPHVGHMAILIAGIDYVLVCSPV